MSDERRAGTTPLRGRPLDENGAIAFEPIELQVINAHALEPGKIYVFEVDRAKISSEQLRAALNYLAKWGINGVIIHSIGGDGLRIVSPEEEKTQT